MLPVARVGSCMCWQLQVLPVARVVDFMVQMLLSEFLKKLPKIVGGPRFDRTLVRLFANLNLCPVELMS